MLKFVLWLVAGLIGVVLIGDLLQRQRKKGGGEQTSGDSMNELGAALNQLVSEQHVHKQSDEPDPPD